MKLQLMDIPEPVLREEGQVLLRIEACGISGSDLRYYKGENPWALRTLGRHVPNPPNMILGHQVAGVVEKVFSKAHEHLIGKRVAVQAFKACGICRLCLTGRENLCKASLHLGDSAGWGKMESYPGGYAQYCAVWGDSCFPMPDHVSFAEAAMADILSVAVHNAGRTRLYPGANVLCIGGGPAGVSIAHAAHQQGAERVFIAEPSDVSRRVVSAYPWCDTIDTVMTDPGDYILQATQGTKCAAVFDTVGIPTTFRLGLGLLDEGGTYIDLAVHDIEMNFSSTAIGSERRVATSTNATSKDVSAAVELIYSGRIDVKPWVTHKFPMESYQDAFKTLLAYPKKAFLAILEPWAAATENNRPS